MDFEREINELKNIVALYRKRGEHRRAAEITKTIIAMQQSLHGPKAKQVAVSLYQLAELLCDAGEYGQAQPLFEQAVDIWQLNHPDELNDLMLYTNALMRLQEQTDELEDEEFGRDENAA